MSKVRFVYLHFEKSPAQEALDKFCSKFPGAASERTFDAAWRVALSDSEDAGAVQSWARECFPFCRYVICTCFHAEMIQEWNDVKIGEL